MDSVATTRLKNLCGGLTLAGQQVPNKSAPSLPSSAGQGKEYTVEKLVKVRSGRDCSALIVIGKTDSALEN